MNRTRHSIWQRAIAAVIVCLFTLNSTPCLADGTFSLAVRPGTGRAKVRRGAKARELRLRKCIRPALSDEERRCLENESAEALLLSEPIRDPNPGHDEEFTAQILTSREVYDNDLALIRNYIHEQVEAVMRIIAWEDGERQTHYYDAIEKSVFPYKRRTEDILCAYYALFPKDRQPDLPPKLLLNDVVAKAFELAILLKVKENLIEQEDLTPEERHFLAKMRRVIYPARKRTSHFGSEFWNWEAREDRIRLAIANGVNFYRVANAGRTAHAGPDNSEEAPVPVDGSAGSIPASNSIRGFDRIARHLKSAKGRFTVVVPAADSESVLLAMGELIEKLGDKVGAILIGDDRKIREIIDKNNLSATFADGVVRIEHVPDNNGAVEKAIALIREGEAHVLLKGNMPTSKMLPAAMKGLRIPGRYITHHRVVFKAPFEPVVLGDGGFNVLSNRAPPEQKRILEQITENGIKIAKILSGGYALAHHLKGAAQSGMPLDRVLRQKPNVLIFPWIGPANIIYKACVVTPWNLKYRGEIIVKSFVFRRPLGKISIFEKGDTKEPLIVATPRKELSFGEKKEFLKRSVAVAGKAVKKAGLAKMGKKARVALLDFTEQAGDFPDTPSIQDEVKLEKYFRKNAKCIVEGPMAYDMAVSARAAEVKKFTPGGKPSRVAGRPDILFSPCRDSGELLTNLYTNWNSFGLPWPAADISYGGLAPILVPSRSDTPRHKLNSIITVAYLIAKQKDGKNQPGGATPAIPQAGGASEWANISLDAVVRQKIEEPGRVRGFAGEPAKLGLDSIDGHALFDSVIHEVTFLAEEYINLSNTNVFGGGNLRKTLEALQERCYGIDGRFKSLSEKAKKDMQITDKDVIKELEDIRLELSKAKEKTGQLRRDCSGDAGDKDTPLKEKIKKYFISIATYYDSLIRIIDTQIGFIAGDISTETVRLGSFVGSVARESKKILDPFIAQPKRPELDISLEFEESPWLVNINTPLIRRMIGEVIKDMYEAGAAKISISAEPSGDRIALSISDNGPGIPEELLKPGRERLKLFELEGIGLREAWRIAKLHGSELAVDSKPGEGTTFTVNLPRSEEEHERPDTTPPLAGTEVDRSKASQPDPERPSGGFGSDRGSRGVPEEAAIREANRLDAIQEEKRTEGPYALNDHPIVKKGLELYRKLTSKDINLEKTGITFVLSHFTAKWPAFWVQTGFEAGKETFKVYLRAQGGAGKRQVLHELLAINDSTPHWLNIIFDRSYVPLFAKKIFYYGLKRLYKKQSDHAASEEHGKPPSVDLRVGWEIGKSDDELKNLKMMEFMKEIARAVVVAALRAKKAGKKVTDRKMVSHFLSLLKLRAPDRFRGYVSLLWDVCRGYDIDSVFGANDPVLKLLYRVAARTGGEKMLYEGALGNVVEAMPGGMAHGNGKLPMQGPGQLGGVQDGQIPPAGEKIEALRNKIVECRIPPPAVGSGDEITTAIVNVYDRLNANEIPVTEAARRIMEEVLPQWAYYEGNVAESATAVGILREGLRVMEQDARYDVRGSPEWLQAVFTREAIEVFARHEYNRDETGQDGELRKLTRRMYNAKFFWAGFRYHRELKEVTASLEGAHHFGDLSQDELEQLKKFLQKTLGLAVGVSRQTKSVWCLGTISSPTMARLSESVGVFNLRIRSILRNFVVDAPLQDTRTTLDDIRGVLRDYARIVLVPGYAVLAGQTAEDRFYDARDVLDEHETDKLLARGYTLDRVARELAATLEFNTSRLALKQASVSGYGVLLQKDDLEPEAPFYGKTGQSIILYADDILESTACMDLEDTVKRILIRHDVVKGGKVVLFARNEANGVIMHRMLRQAGLAEEAIAAITKGDLDGKGVREGDDYGEIKAIVELAKAKGARPKNILALVRGPLKTKLQFETNRIAQFARTNEVPIFIVGKEKALYSLRDAVEQALYIKSQGERYEGPILILLKPAGALTTELLEEYERSLRALQSA